MCATLLPTLISAAARRPAGVLGAFVLGVALLLSACGGGGVEPGQERVAEASAAQTRLDAEEAQGPTDGPSSDASFWSGLTGALDGALETVGLGDRTKAATSQVDAVRLAHQATFGPTEALVALIREQGAERWIASQMSLNRQAFKRTPGGQTGPVAVRIPHSRYTSGGTSAVHRHTSQTVDFCAGRGEHCWRDWSSSTPLVWDFYRNAVHNPDQLRQRVGLALQQMLVISNYEVYGTYGLRNYHNMLLDHAFGNYRDLLRKVILSPVMGDYLDHVNNDRNAPNENFARELLQLFSLGTCLLNQNGTLQGGQCVPTYNNEEVRAYAHALTGWTYPPGGATPWGCWPRGANCQFYDGDMVSVATLHDTRARSLLSGVTLAAGHSAPVALEAVLNSVMAHPNIAPFVSRHLIQQLVTSNPSPAYVQRVALAFSTGRHGNFGAGRKGDLAATVAAVLLDAEARSASPGNTAGRLREPIQLFTGVLRALNGRTDGDALGWWWGDEMRQHVFRSPSVFNFYPPDYPVAGTALVGPAFGIHNANTALNRLNYLNYLLFWGGSGANGAVPNAVGTQVNLSAFTADAANAATLVDRLSRLALGDVLPTASRNAVITAVNAYPGNTADGRLNRVRQAAFLVFASPQYHLVR
jgi:hypothetical protein